MSEANEGGDPETEKCTSPTGAELLILPVPEHKHDLVPIHSLLLDHAIHLQEKVNQEIFNIGVVRRKLAREMSKVAESLISLGGVSLPDGFHIPASIPPDSEHHTVLQAILSIHRYRDFSVKLLETRSSRFRESPAPPRTNQTPTDFNEASDDMDKSFHYLRTLLDQIGECGKELQVREEGGVNLRRFSSEMCRQIDALEKQYVFDKMEELNFRSCSIQSRKPVKSIGHTLDLQEIMSLAKNAKSMVYEVSLKMLRIVDHLKGAEISSVASYHAITKENSELLRRYCFYLKLKIKQL
jgi:hypothetical protein